MSNTNKIQFTFGQSGFGRVVVTCDLSSMSLINMDTHMGECSQFDFKIAAQGAVAIFAAWEAASYTRDALAFRAMANSAISGMEVYQPLLISSICEIEEFLATEE